MKHTKKRALISAVAMLIVSVVVLSSATYAWFQVGDKATIEEITANVATSSAIEISADKSSWSGNLPQTSLSGRGDNSFPDQLGAISTSATSGMNFFTGELLNTRAFESKVAGSVEKAANLVKFTFYIRANGATDVKYTNSSLLGGALVSTYVAIQIGTSDNNAAASTPLVFSGANTNTYVPITAAALGTDSNDDGIMTTSDTPSFAANLGSPVSCNVLSNAATFHLDTGVVRQVIVYMWLEGNDPQCITATGGATGSAALALQFEKA